MIYYVIELQTTTSGAALVTAYNNRVQAESAYYSVLHSAVQSSVPKHGVLMVTEDLNLLKSDLAYKEIEQEPGVEPEVEPES